MAYDKFTKLDSAKHDRMIKATIGMSRPKFDSSLGVWHTDLALRWSKALGEWDMGLAHFWGTSREPRFDLNLADPLHPSLIPRYGIINQTSLDVQYTHGAWLWKLEAITRSGQYRRFQATVAGLEYTFFDLLHSGVNLGLLAEYLYDGRSQDVRQAPPTPYNNDIFLGLRLSLEDTQNTDLLMGLVRDLGSGAKFVNIEASRRFGSAWKAEMKARFFMDAPFQDFVLYGFHQDDYVQMRLGYYF